MMKLFLVASLIAFTVALKDSPRRQKSTSQNTKRALHGKSSKYSRNTVVVTTAIPSTSNAVESTMTFEDRSFGGPNMDPENPVDNTQIILKLVQIGVVSKNADNNVFQSVNALTSPKQETPTEVLSQTSIDASSLDTEEDGSEEFSSDVPAPAPALTPSTTFPREVKPTAFSSDTPSLIPSSVPSSATLPTGATSTALSSDVPSLLPSLVPSSLSREAAGTAFSSDAPSLVPSMAPSTPTEAQLSSDAPSLVPSLVPSSAEALGDTTRTAFSSDAPSLVPSTNPSSATSLVPSSVPTLIAAGEASPTSPVPSARPSDDPSVVPSSTPISVPSSVPSSFSVDPDAVSVFDPSSFAKCEQYDSPAFDDSITAEIAVDYWYNLEVEEEVNSFNVPISQLVETVEIVLLETVQATMCAETPDRRRLATNSIAFSAAPLDLRMGT
jgi:hypothetical protein